MLQDEERRESNVWYPEVVVLVEDREERTGTLMIEVAETQGEWEQSENWLEGAFGLRADARRRRDDDEDADESDDDFGDDAADDEEEYDDDLDDDVDDDLDDDDLDDDFDDDFEDDDDE